MYGSGQKQADKVRKGQVTYRLRMFFAELLLSRAGNKEVFEQAVARAERGSKEPELPLRHPPRSGCIMSQ
jgi:hypothetical protein